MNFFENYYVGIAWVRLFMKQYRYLLSCFISREGVSQPNHTLETFALDFGEKFPFVFHRYLHFTSVNHCFKYFSLKPGKAELFTSLQGCTTVWDLEQ